MTKHDDFPPLPEHLKEILSKPEPKPEIKMPGECHIHGRVGFARFILHDHGDLLGEYCAKCLAKVMTALLGELTYPDKDKD